MVLVGDSGVGKSGLAHRLIDNKFVDTKSTHGMSVRKLELPSLADAPKTEREVWLWDLAGQEEYRLVHQLFLDETAVGLLVFDAPQDDLPKVVGYWQKALRKAVSGWDYKTLLVGARADRGRPKLTREKIGEYCTTQGISDFVLTSANTGEGAEALRKAIAAHIPWETLHTTTAPRLFKTLKDTVIALRDRDDPLVNYKTLRMLLEKELPTETFSDAVLRTILGQLSGQGLIRQLDFGDFYLLRPELMNAYASSVVVDARDQGDGIGCLREEDVLEGNINFKDLERLSDKNDEKILLRAMVQTFVDKSLCIRESSAQGVLLVFPSQFNREYPIPNHPEVLITYRFAGPVVNLYTTLVVRLRYSFEFERKDLWKNAAEFTTNEGKTVGFVLTPTGEGSGEIRVFFDPGVPDDTRVTLIKYVHEHLSRYAIEGSVERVRHYVCPACGEPVTDQKALAIRQRQGKKDIRCHYCDHDIPLRDIIEEKAESDAFLRKVRQMDETAQINIDNESRELILVGHAFVMAGEAGQIFRTLSNSDHGIDGEIEFKDKRNRATGKRVYLQLKSGDSYLRHRHRDDEFIFDIPDERHIAYWQAHHYDVYLVIRTSQHGIQWMNITEYLRYREDRESKQVRFRGEPFTAEAVLAARKRLVGE